jgi:hypothetical protein
MVVGGKIIITDSRIKWNKCNIDLVLLTGLAIDHGKMVLGLVWKIIMIDKSMLKIK